MTWEKLNQTWHYVEKWANARPDADALIFGEEKLTWRNFKEKMDAIAGAYLEIGIEKGDRVAMLSMARNEFLTTYMAAGKVGAIWLGLSPKYTLEELRYNSTIAVRNYSSPCESIWAATCLTLSEPS